LLGCNQKVVFKQAADALYISMPAVENTGKTICFAVQ